MVNISYKPLIDDMVWSYSRIKTFQDCPYRFFLRYIKEYKDADKFYAGYGGFIHKLIEKYYNGEINKENLAAEFLLGFKNEVHGIRPSESVAENYIKSGCDYFKNFSPFPFNMIEVEKRVEFNIEERSFIGFLDYIGEKDGNIYIVDSKSRNLSPRSGREKPTAKDAELDDMLKQLYLYSVAVEQEYGRFPAALCFNCFRNRTFIKEKFDIQKYEETKQWAIDSIDIISQTEEFIPKQNFFVCRYICGVSDRCKYDIEAWEEYNKR